MGTGQVGLRGVDYACAPCVGLSAIGVKSATASSSLDPADRYGPQMAVDGDLSTAWCEGTDGSGEGSTLRLAFDKPAIIEAVAVWGGFFKSEDLLKANGRVTQLRVRSDAGLNALVDYADPAVALETDPSTMAPIEAGGWFEHSLQGESPWVGVRGDSEWPSHWIELRIEQVAPGGKYTDTCISEIDLLLIDPEEL